MSQTIYRAIIQNGVAVPVEPLQVADGTEVTVTILAKSDDTLPSQNQNDIFEILSRRYNGGEKDTAARHNEHQP